MGTLTLETLDRTRRVTYLSALLLLLGAVVLALAGCSGLAQPAEAPASQFAIVIVPQAGSDARGHAEGGPSAWADVWVTQAGGSTGADGAASARGTLRAAVTGQGAADAAGGGDGAESEADEPPGGGE